MKIDEILNKLKNAEVKDLYFGFDKQENQNVEEVLKEKFKCEFLPKEYLDFMKKYNGGDFGLIEIYSLERLEDESNLQSWGQTEVDVNEVLEFATDGCGDSFYFYKNKPDNKIYYWSHEVYSQVYPSFIEWLNEEVETEIKIAKELEEENQ